MSFPAGQRGGVAGVHPNLQVRAAPLAETVHPAKVGRSDGAVTQPMPKQTKTSQAIPKREGVMSGLEGQKTSQYLETLGCLTLRQSPAGTAHSRCTSAQAYCGNSQSWMLRPPASPAQCRAAAPINLFLIFFIRFLEFINIAHKYIRATEQIIN